MSALQKVDPSLRAGIARMPRVKLESALTRSLVRFVTRRFPAATVPSVSVQEIVSGPARYRLYLPEQRSGAGLVWVHGGGLVIGSVMQTDRLCAQTARELGMVIASAHYRLAPEHPFPAAHDDVYAVWADLHARAREFGVDPARIAVGGESAGGGLAASLTHRLVDEGTAPAAQWLVYPMLDDRTAAREDLDALNHLVWDNRSNRFGWSSYLGQQPGLARTPPYAVPARREDLRGTPPTWIGVGNIDLFHDENTAYAGRLSAAGVTTAIDVVRGAPHGFETAAPNAELVQEFQRRARLWLKDHT